MVLVNSTAYCHIFVPLHLEMCIFPVVSHTSYVRRRTGNKALWWIQECSRDGHSSLCAVHKNLHCKAGKTYCYHCVSTLPISVRGMQTYFSAEAHPSRAQELPHSTRTFLILPPDAASCLVTMAGTKSSGEGCFLEGGSILYLVSLSSAAETAESQLGRVNKLRNIRRKLPRSRRFPASW